MKSMRRGGFTLLELLTVLATMAILAAIMFPVIAQARACARQSVCASHLHQLAQAGLLYLTDYDEHFPSCYRIPAPPYVIDPSTLLQPYLHDTEVLYCPERHTRMLECVDPQDPRRRFSRCLGYGYNWGSGLTWDDSYVKGDGLVRLNGDGSEGATGVSLSEVAMPAHCFLFGDTNDFLFLTLLRGAMPGVRQSGDPDALTNELGKPYEPARHRGGNHFAFVDGHVEWLRFPGGRWIDGGPWVVPDMGMYSRTGRWEPGPVP